MPHRSDTSELPEVIAARLRQFDRGRRWMLLLRSLAEAVAVFCLGVILVAALEALVKPPFAWRAGLSAAVYLASGAGLAYRGVWPWLRRPQLREVAWEFEFAAGNHFEERIVSAVELAGSRPGEQPGVSSWMIGRTIQLAAEEIGAVDTRSLIDGKPAARAGKRAGAGVLILAAACVIPGFGSRMLLALNPAAPTAVLSNILLTVTPGDCRIRHGTPLEIQASGENLPAQATLRIRWRDGFQEAVPMQRNGSNLFVLTLASVAHGFRYSVQAADAQSAVFKVDVEVPPRIARVQLRLEPPSYTGWSNRMVEGGSADFLAGSKIEIVIEPADELVAEAVWMSDLPQSRKFKPDHKRLVLELQPTNQVTYQVKLTGVNKLQSVPSPKWVLRPTPDQPPSARLQGVGSELGLVQHDEVLPLQIRAADDVGLKRLDLIVLSKDTDTVLQTLYARGAQAARREFNAPLNYNLADLNTVSGEEVQLQLVAMDLLDQTTRSETLSFAIGSADKALEAQLASRLKLLVSDFMTQIEFLQQTRASWLGLARNYSETDPFRQGPALAVLKSRLREAGQQIDNLGQRLVTESETNLLAEARFMYRLGTTISSWGRQQREVLLANCSQIERARGTNLFECFTLGRELFTRAMLDLEQYRRVVAILASALETDVLATCCESAQARYKRGLPVMRGENTIAPLGQAAFGLRPPAAREVPAGLATNAILSAAVQSALKERVKYSLAQPAVVPAALAPLTNEVQNETLRRLIQEKSPVSAALLTNLASFASWTAEQSRDPEGKADDLTGAASAARRILREELEKYRWRYEGAAALKEVQNAIEELRDLTRDLRRLPWNGSKTRSEEEHAKVQLAKVWQRELQRAAAQAAHDFFEVAKQKEATLAQRATALTAAAQAEEQLQPSAGKLAGVLEQDRNKDELAGGIEQQLNDTANKYRELNELQEKINREEVAARARRALPPARSFARAQQAGDHADTQSRYELMKPAVADVVKALRVAGDYDEAQQLLTRAGEAAETAQGKETAQQVRDLAMRTDNNIASLAQSIPPPMRRQTEALERSTMAQQDSAQALARPRLAMSLESARLVRHGDRQTAVAYGLLGQDLGALLDAPEQLAAGTLRPLADRAAALAGEKGEEARQAEIRAANERLRQLATSDPNNAEVLAGRLDAASLLARQAAGEVPKRRPLASELNEMSELASPPSNWADAVDPREIAAGAASESASQIQAAPNQWESYNGASEMLAEAARQIRSDTAASELAALSPFPSPPSAADLPAQDGPAAMDANGPHQGAAGHASTQPAPRGLDQAEWARLAERLRQGINSSGIENFSPEQQAAIRAYFERLSSDNHLPNQ